MELLKELADIVSKQKIKNIDLLDVNSKNNITYKLYDNLCLGAIDNDNRAIDLLYDGDVKMMQALQKNKQRLKKKLLNLLFFIDTNQSNFSEFKKAHIECSKAYILLKILLYRGARKLAIEMSEKAISVSQKYRFADMIVLHSSELMYHYGALEYKKGKFEKYSNLNSKYIKHLLNENEVKRIYSTFINHF